MITKEISSMSHTLTHPPAIDPAFDIAPDLTVCADPLAWMVAMADSNALGGKEKTLLWPLMVWAGEFTGRVDACDAGYDETASKLGVNAQKVRAAWKHAEDLGFLVELPDGCLQLTVPAGTP